MKNWIRHAQDVGNAMFSKTSDAIGTGAGYVRATLGKVSLFGSVESSKLYDKKADERHYFLIPDRRTGTGYSLYVLRCLPDNVPVINDLPKHRLFHLPNEHALPTVEHILLSDAREAAQDTETKGAVSSRLADLADQVDRLDKQVFHGVLLIGGLVALINPVAGAVVAAKALVPSVAMLFSKYGLQYAGEGIKSVEVSQRVKSAERDVLKQFKGSQTDSLVNPLLEQLDKALDTTEDEYDPVMEFDTGSLEFGKRDQARLVQLTCQAISNTYEEILQNPTGAQLADLGPEDLRFLRLLKELSQAT